MSPPTSDHHDLSTPPRPSSASSTVTGNARALADDGHTPPRHQSLNPIDPSLANSTSSSNGASSSLLQPPSPNTARRISLTPGGTTKVLADLQTGVIQAKTALENTKAQLRLSQRSVAQLTRQTEDLKEVRERLRLENEGLNNVVARKERLLQEVRITLDRCDHRDSLRLSILFPFSYAYLFLMMLTSTHHDMYVCVGPGASTKSRSRRDHIQVSAQIRIVDH